MCAGQNRVKYMAHLPNMPAEHAYLDRDKADKVYHSTRVFHLFLCIWNSSSHPLGSVVYQ